MKSCWRKWLAGLLSIAMLFAMLPTTALAVSDQPASDPDTVSPEDADFPFDDWGIAPMSLEDVVEYDADAQSLTIRDSCTYSLGPDAEIKTILVTGGSVKLNLAGVTVENETGCAFDIQGGSVTLELAEGTTNSFASGNYYAGIHVAEGASLIINGPGALTATSKKTTGLATYHGAGIGGNGGRGDGLANRDNAGSITINGGTITAVSEGDGAGIGGGWTDQGTPPVTGTFQSITINGGFVTAVSNGNGAGIGCGCWATSMGPIVINGGVIHAKSVAPNYSACDIGYGHRTYVYSGTASISISGALIYTEGKNGIQAEYVTKNDCICVNKDNDIEVNGNPTLQANLTVGKKLTVPEGSTFTVPNGVTLTISTGAMLTVENGASFLNQGNVLNQGIIFSTGTVRGVISGNQPMGCRLIAPSFDALPAGYTEKEAEAKPILVENTERSPITVQLSVSGDIFDLVKIENTVPGKQQVNVGTIRPKTGLESGIYTDTIRVQCTANGQTVTLEKTVELRVTQNGISYLDSDGVQKYANAVPVTENTTVLQDGWYVAQGSTKIKRRISVQGDVHLILSDGCELNVSYGISVLGGNSLTIYCQKGRPGALWTSNPSGGGAAIGGDRGASAGDITINGGNINATVYLQGGACIGEGGWSGAPGNVTINDGHLSLTCTAGTEGAFGTNFTINGGIIEYAYDRNPEHEYVPTEIDEKHVAGGIVCVDTWSAFEAGSGKYRKVYGEVTLKENFAVGYKDTLVVQEGTSLIIPEGITLTNQGTLENGGTIYNDGEIINDQRIQNDGIIYNYGEIKDNQQLNNNGEIKGKAPNSQYRLEVSVSGLEGEIVHTGYEQPPAKAITVTNCGSNAAEITRARVEGDGFTLTGSYTGTIAASESRNDWTVELNDWSAAGEYNATVIITYNVGREASVPVTFQVISEAVYRLQQYGDGSEKNPYQIPDLETLEAFQEYINSEGSGEGEYFLLTHDIDLSERYGEDANGGKVAWEPIDKFSGVFYGGGYSISGLYIDASESGKGNVGFFGTLSQGTVQDLNLSGTVKGSAQAESCSGGIVGNNEAGVIANCSFTGTVMNGDQTSKSYCGGIAGRNSGVITCCSFDGSVSGGSVVGGIAGLNYTDISNCFNKGTVSGDGSNYSNGHGEYVTIGGVGGIVGQNAETVENCYNIGTVSANENVGNVVGANGQESYYFGIITTDSGTVDNCYFFDELIGDAAATEKTAEQFKSGEVAWLLQDGQSDLVWGQAVGADAYPVLTGDATKTVFQVQFVVDEDSVYDIEYTNATLILPEPPTKLNHHFTRSACTSTKALVNFLTR